MVDCSRFSGSAETLNEGEDKMPCAVLEKEIRVKGAVAPKGRRCQLDASVLLACGLACAAFLPSVADGSARWPFIVVRHSGAINKAPETFKELAEYHRQYRGACDEFWFWAGARGTPDAVARDCAAIARFRPLCDEVGVTFSYQQGLTLGHGPARPGKPRPGEQPFSDDAWQKDKNGNVVRFPCPRAPEVVAYEREYAKAVMRTTNPASYWLDDDLRLGVYKPDGCFCDRCLAAFNAKTGGAWTRETLAARLFSKAVREPVRKAWLDFNSGSWNIPSF